ncbi:ferritin-like domain-containing protein [Hymenobacter sp. BT188]|uniref:ferritin-like domain-containing protein n=1 Tax=Hymenobacter sp. BT188 TaxID=2763504 RepID=UPI001650D869|nr:ferritin-like domain-containing protein [Hymenobacter sp. BT188]MBC6606417.1 ferritin-like domain-containing protein [Hymenobacter sp. BT188]
MDTKSTSLSRLFSARPVLRRTFFRVAGATAASSALVLAGCDKEDETPEVTPEQAFTLGTGDTGLLNYVYLLEQLEAAFYDKVVATPPADMPSTELAYFTDIRDHEVIHREFFKFALGTSAIGTAVFNFSSFTLTTRAGVLAAAQTLEDLGVAAYNGAGKLFTDPVYLGIAGKIASVEARHAALVRDLVQPNSFATADVVVNDGSALDGLDAAKTPAQVIAVVNTFLNITISAASLPA